MWDAEESRDAILIVTLGFYHHLKNHWSGRHRHKNTYFRFSTIINGRRESRRFIGDYNLTQDDCISGATFDDAISYSGWAIDIHHPDDVYSGKEGPLYISKWVNVPKIPFRCLYSKNINNLLFAGRNISVTHIALGTVRVQNTIATLGQAAGTAAAMCIELDETPRGIYERHIRKLQQLLIKNDQYIPGFKNEDEGDPCLTATATASSVSTTEIFMQGHGIIGSLVPLDVARATVSGFSAKMGDIHGVYVKLRSDLTEPRTVKLSVITLGDLDTSNSFDDVFTAEAEIPPMTESWVFFPVYIKIIPDNFQHGSHLQLWIEAEPGISWRSTEKLSFYHKNGVRREDGSWKWTGGSCLNFAITVPKDIIADCSPEAVINGHSRILSEKEYEWVSNPTEALPQWLQLDFAKPTDINRIDLVFDTDMTNPGTCWWQKYPHVFLCVKDYTVEVYDGKNWIQVSNVKDNFMRKRIHTFSKITVERIRITVNETWGDPSARITEVRASLES